MSVTFYADQPIIGSVVRCFEHETAAVLFDTHEQAAASLYERHEIPATCSVECIMPMGGAYIDAARPEVLPEVNMSNANARDVLAALGVDADAEDWAGTFQAADLQVRASLALTLARRSPALESIRYQEDGGVQVVECGREEGYLQARLAEVERLAILANSRGLSVIWA